MIGKFHFISQQNSQHSHLEGIRAALKAGIKWVQLRIKDQSMEMIAERAAEARKICDEYGGKLIINDHPAIARQVNADGLHLGKDDMSLMEARKIVGSMIIGATANTFDDIRKHAEDGADYIGLGPYRFTATKRKLSPILGLQGYREILSLCHKNNIRIPVLAIGGIEPEDISYLKETGIHGIAASSMVLKCRAGEVKQILKILNEEYANLRG